MAFGNLEENTQDNTEVSLIEVALRFKNAMLVIQFRLVYMKIKYIWNDGEMPADLDSTDKLFMKHSSKPYNPKLANVFF